MGNIILYEGTYNSCQFDIGNNDDVSAYTISFFVAKKNGDTILLTKANGSGIDMTDAATGTIYIEITVNDTKTLGIGTFIYELRFEIDSKPEIWDEGSLLIKKAIYVP